MPLLLKLKSILCSSKILHNITTKTGGSDMKIVFDDWDVKYNKEVLDKAIKDTKEALEKADK